MWQHRIRCNNCYTDISPGFNGARRRYPQRQHSTPNNTRGIRQSRISTQHKPKRDIFAALIDFSYVTSKTNLNLYAHSISEC